MSLYADEMFLMLLLGELQWLQKLTEKCLSAYNSKEMEYILNIMGKTLCLWAV